ncbi:hypothetical protein [Spongiactinospora sp. 9N601]|uniref:hypothetical protein n=1 Tax=Spongiactinospora sp. 9N601 TaxID=3375149 RepID=UPI0037A72A99
MDELTIRERAHLGALEVTFPGWRISVRGGVWWATRHAAPTDAQKAAGLCHQLARWGPIELADALTAQLGILVRMGAA